MFLNFPLLFYPRLGKQFIGNNVCGIKRLTPQPMASIHIHLNQLLPIASSSRGMSLNFYFNTRSNQLLIHFLSLSLHPIYRHGDVSESMDMSIGRPGMMLLRIKLSYNFNRFFFLSHLQLYTQITLFLD